MKKEKYFLAFALAACFVFVVAADASPRVERRKPLAANVGVVSVGLDTYWKQCPGLYEDMVKKAAVFEKRDAPRFCRRAHLSAYALFRPVRRRPAPVLRNPWACCI